MKVSELIQELQKVDGDLIVFVRGYESGIDVIESVGPVINVALNVNDAWYYGKHEPIDDKYDEKLYSDHKKVKGVQL